MRLVETALENAGIATVIVGMMPGPLRGANRAVVTSYERGVNFGLPTDVEEHRRVARTALELLRNAEAPTLLQLEKQPAPAP